MLADEIPIWVHADAAARAAADVAAEAAVAAAAAQHDREAKHARDARTAGRTGKLPEASRAEVIHTPPASNAGLRVCVEVMDTASGQAATTGVRLQPLQRADETDEQEPRATGSIAATGAASSAASREWDGLLSSLGGPPDLRMFRGNKAQQMRAWKEELLSQLSTLEPTWADEVDAKAASSQVPLTLASLPVHPRCPADELLPCLHDNRAICTVSALPHPHSLLYLFASICVCVCHCLTTGHSPKIAECDIKGAVPV